MHNRTSSGSLAAKTLLSEDTAWTSLRSLKTLLLRFPRSRCIPSPLTQLPLELRSHRSEYVSCISFANAHIMHREPEIRLVDLKSNKVVQLEGHTKAVRRVTWHPSGDFLVSEMTLVLVVSQTLSRRHVAQTVRSLSGTPRQASQRRCKLSMGLYPKYQTQSQSACTSHRLLGLTSILQICRVSARLFGRLAHIWTILFCRHSRTRSVPLSLSFRCLH